MARVVIDVQRCVHAAPLAHRVDGQHGDDARRALPRALRTPEPPQPEEQKEERTYPQYSPRDPCTSSLYVPLRLQTQQVPEPLFVWDVIQQPHATPPLPDRRR